MWKQAFVLAERINYWMTLKMDGDLNLYNLSVFFRSKFYSYVYLVRPKCNVCVHRMKRSDDSGNVTVPDSTQNSGQVSSATRNQRDEYEEIVDNRRQTYQQPSATSNDAHTYTSVMSPF